MHGECSKLHEFMLQTFFLYVISAWARMHKVAKASKHNAPKN